MARDEANAEYALLEEEEEEEGLRHEISAFLKLVWPVALTSIIEFVPSLVSVAVVGRFCDRNALDGAALGTMYFNIAALSIGLGLTTAMDTLAPQAVGAGKNKLLGVYVQRGGLVLGVLLVPIACAGTFAGSILRGLGQPPEVAHRAGEYVRWSLPSLPCFWAFELVRKVFHAFGIVRPLVWIGVASTLSHCVLAYALVATDWFVADLGFAGAAVARSCSMFVALASLCAYSAFSGLSEKWWPGVVPLSILTRDVATFLRLGGAGCAAICFEWWAFEMLALFAGLLPKRPDVYIGAHAVLFNLAALFYMGLSGCAAAASVRTGLALGAGDAPRAKRAVAVSLAFALFVGAANAVALFACRDVLPGLFARDNAIRHAAMIAMPALSVYQVFDAWNAVSGGVMRGAGRQETPAFIMLAAYYIFGIPAALVLAFARDYRLVGLWLGLTFGLVIASVMLGYGLLTLDWPTLVIEARERADAHARRISSDDDHADRLGRDTVVSTGVSLPDFDDDGDDHDNDLHHHNRKLDDFDEEDIAVC
ncbi:hypothetical protein CTAYLR_006541 [Chrysophaeum taylorii]|uniref:Multidrug and toxic compound extrusion protein n=1 Tax=Chrysophaeum taylorii TaxID=2483200 RepID=A0AAD7XJJ8_9STRA|nr:hypothetical protein CTAYLR_006541 [Chrysophaeum taylorii]